MPAASDAQRVVSSLSLRQVNNSEVSPLVAVILQLIDRIGAQTLEGKNQCIPSVDGDFRGSLYHIEPSVDFHGDWAPRWGSRFNPFHPVSLAGLSSAATHYGKTPQ